MSNGSSHRGGAPVGLITDLGPVEAGAVFYFRLWSDGPDSQNQVWNEFASILGSAHGRQALKAFENLCGLCRRHARRPLMRHGISCQCLGADESCFANLIGFASEGSREDAFLLAINLVRADVAGILVDLAEEFGLALKRITLKADGFSGTHPQPTKLQ